MALLTVITAVALVSIAMLYAVVRLTVYVFQMVQGGHEVDYAVVLDPVITVYQLFLMVVLLYLFGNGLAQWLIDVWRFVIQLL